MLEDFTTPCCAIKHSMQKVLRFSHLEIHAELVLPRNALPDISTSSAIFKAGNVILYLLCDLVDQANICVLSQLMYIDYTIFF